jgi:hypothetical protein
MKLVLVISQDSRDRYRIHVRNQDTGVQHVLHSNMTDWNRVKLEAAFDAEQIFGNCPVITELGG